MDLIEQLGKLGVYELRKYARAVGVRTPTAKKSAELIDEIVRIKEGLQEPYFPLKRRGRPCSKIFTDNETSWLDVTALQSKYERLVNLVYLANEIISE